MQGGIPKGLPKRKLTALPSDSGARRRRAPAWLPVRQPRYSNFRTLGQGPVPNPPTPPTARLCKAQEQTSTPKLRNLYILHPTCVPRLESLSLGVALGFLATRLVRLLGTKHRDSLLLRRLSYLVYGHDQSMSWRQSAFSWEKSLVIIVIGTRWLAKKVLPKRCRGARLWVQHQGIMSNHRPTALPQP